MANEKWLIDAEDLKSAIVEDVEIRGESFSRVIRHIEAQPAVDAVEVVHGRWCWKPTNEWTYILTCSVCGSQEGTCETYKYCPKCGSKMDGDGNG